jgi:hypothetical protein
MTDFMNKTKILILFGAAIGIVCTITFAAGGDVSEDFFRGKLHAIPKTIKIATLDDKKSLTIDAKEEVDSFARCLQKQTMVFQIED